MLGWGIRAQWSALEPWMQATLGLLGLLMLATLTRLVIVWVLKPVLRRLRESAQHRWFEVLMHDKVLDRTARILPTLVVQLGIMRVPYLHEELAKVIGNLAMAFMVLQIVRMLMSILDELLVERRRRAQEQGLTTVSSIKSYVQLAKLVLMLGGAIIMVASLLDRSPLIVLSGLGAMSAVLMLVFKDTLLSFTAGVLLSSNDLLRLGDWIEMPQVGADGEVVDIALHTVRVQNWDKTITTIPTWRLVAESYKNWRGMREAGGRRIKRTVRIDTQSVRFLTPQEVAQLGRIELLHEFMAVQAEELQEINHRVGQLLPPDRAQLPANQRRLTNLGVFRAYTLAYLRAHPEIHQDMLLMVRTMEPGPEGVPVEVYCFAGTTAWVEYERIQGELFDHLMAVLPEFGLRIYQQPSGEDLRSGLRSRPEASEA